MSLSNWRVFYASANFITFSVTGEFQPPALDFDVAASSPSPVTSGQRFTATITVTGSKDFSGRVVIAGEFPSGLLCGSINPAFVYSSGTAKVDCSSQTPGTYKIMITGYAVCNSSDYYGPCSRSIELDVTVLGSALNPVYFYGGIGAIVAVLETVARGFLHLIRRPHASLVGLRCLLVTVHEVGRSSFFLRCFVDRNPSFSLMVGLVSKIYNPSYSSCVAHGGVV